MKTIQILDVANIKRDFPIFDRKIDGKELVYLDSAATSLKPKQVIEAVRNYYEQYCASVHRGIYKISEEATEKYEGTRDKVADFADCDSDEVIFTKNTTESINIVANSLSHDLNKDDEILITQMEHHSNLVPWQQIAKMKKAKLRFVEIDDSGELKMDQFTEKINEKTKIVSVAHVSNVLGTINDVEEISKIAHENDALCLVDGAQAAPHKRFSFRKIGCDFYAFSGHKMLAPTGIGCLVGKKEVLEHMKPFNYGGDMIREVKFDETDFNDVPWKFEAGTPNIAGVIGLGEAINFLNKLGFEAIERHEKLLADYAVEKLNEIDVKVYGPEDRAGLVSFNVDEIHPHDVATVLDSENIAIRAGHHCAMPLMKLLGLSSTARASFYLYNNREDVDFLIKGIEKARKLFS